MQDKTSIGISDTFREFIEALAEEVVINGEPFDAQKKWLRKYSEAEGFNYESIESNLNYFFEAIKELEEHESKSTERLIDFLAKDCCLSEALVNKLIANAAAIRTPQMAESKAQWQEKIEVERKAKENAERLALAEKQAREKAERKAKEVAERKAREDRDAFRAMLVERTKTLIAVRIVAIVICVIAISVLEIFVAEWWCIPALLSNLTVIAAIISIDECMTMNSKSYTIFMIIAIIAMSVGFFSPYFRWWSLTLPIFIPTIVGMAAGAIGEKN